MMIVRAAIILLMATGAHAQAVPSASAAPASAPPQSSTTQPALAPGGVEVFNGPIGKRMEAAAYPLGERKEGRDGWVNLNFMIDPRGKPYEIVVTDSTGNKRFEEAAIQAAQGWEFEPATLAGVPIDSSYTVHVKFLLTGAAAASPQFASAYKDFHRALKTLDKSKVDAALAQLKVKNLYEDAYYNLARYERALHWGTEAQQLEAVQQALAGERDADYLPQKLFVAGLETLLNLQIKRNDFGGALITWDNLKEQADAPAIARWEHAVARLNELRHDRTPYTVAGDFGAYSSWYLRLFRKSFHISVTNGSVAEIKLRCDKRYVFFKYDPETHYTIADKYGDCSMELIGDPGTRFQLVQS